MKKKQNTQEYLKRQTDWEKKGKIKFKIVNSMHWIVYKSDYLSKQY